MRIYLTILLLFPLLALAQSGTNFNYPRASADVDSLTYATRWWVSQQGSTYDTTYLYTVLAGKQDTGQYLTSVPAWVQDSLDRHTDTLQSHNLRINAKQNTLTNPVTGTGVSGYLPHFTGTSTIDSSSLYYDAANKRLGIGTTAPASALDVYGTISLNGTQAIKYPTGMTGSMVVGNGGVNMQNTTGEEGYYNTLLGVESGGDLTKGLRNTFVGYRASRRNTTGNYNTSLGTYSGYNGLTAVRNVNLGHESGYSNYYGGYNVLIGDAAGYSLSISNTVAVGGNALTNITTGANNVGIGYNSGRYAGSGTTANQTSASSLYLGYDTRASANGNTNEIVIGPNAIGSGSNTVTLGHTDITKTVLRGSVGVGTTAPTATLEVNSKSASAPQFRTYNSVLGEATPTDSLGLFVAADGKVGIGTTAPNNNITINSDNVDIGAQIGSTLNTGFIKIVSAVQPTSAAFYPFIKGFPVGDYGFKFRGIKSATSAASTPVFALQASNSTATGAVDNNQIAIQFQNWTSNSMTILGSGSVGIGTTNPQSKLTVTGGALRIPLATDSVKFNTPLVYMPNLVAQDTAKKIVGYNVATGQLKAMTYIHGLMFIDSTTYTPVVNRYAYTKLTPTMNYSDLDGITMRGDSIIVLTAGDYYVHLGCAVAGNNNNDYHIKMFVNGAKAVVPGGSCFFSTTSTANFVPVSWFWYKVSLAANTYLDFRITNNTNNDDPIFKSMKVFIERKFE